VLREAIPSVRRGTWDFNRCLDRAWMTALYWWKTQMGHGDPQLRGHLRSVDKLLQIRVQHLEQGDVLEVPRCHFLFDEETSAGVRRAKHAGVFRAGAGNAPFSVVILATGRNEQVGQGFCLDGSHHGAVEARVKVGQEEAHVDTVWEPRSSVKEGSGGRAPSRHSLLESVPGWGNR